MGSISLFAITTAFGVVQSLLLGIVLFTVDRNNRKANRILAFLLILIGMSILPIFFLHAPKPPLIGAILRMFPDVRFLFGPLLLFYAEAMMRMGGKAGRRRAFHFLPFIISALCSFSSRMYDFSIWQRVNTAFTFLCYAHLFAYSILTIKLIDRYVLGLKDSFSSLKRRSLSWLKYVAVSFIAIFGFMAACETLHLAGFEAGILSIRNELVASLVALFVSSIGFFGIRQPELFSGDKPETKYLGSSLKPEDCESFHARLVEYMKKARPYHDCELNLEKLALGCGIPDYHISRVINEKEGMKFYDFINSHRIGEVREAMRDPGSDRYTILALAFDSGFNSKSAFYAAFRKAVGMTPMQFKQLLRTKGKDA